MASENSRYLLHGTARREAFSLKDIAAINCFFAEESLPYEASRLAEIVIRLTSSIGSSVFSRVL
ncbi:MAG TPA: hypothetical protein VL093_07780 [Flavipsychrobacter sp.]|nr:hypothetical protein [Flavipsychrobacter sp.]